MTETHKCCHGFEKTRDSSRGITCHKVDLHTVEETAESLGAKEFMRSIKNNGLTERITENITMFVPLDSAFTDFSEKMFETVSQMCLYFSFVSALHADGKNLAICLFNLPLCGKMTKKLASSHIHVSKRHEMLLVIVSPKRLK